MPEATFTALTPADFATVAALGDRIWRQHYAAIISMAQIEYMLAGRYTDAKLAAYVDAPDRWLLIVRAGDDPRRQVRGRGCRRRRPRSRFRGTRARARAR